MLGSGGMGSVYLARDVNLGRRVALKFLRPEVLDSKARVERFVHEARTTARFSHPHIVAIHHVGEFRDQPYLALEYLDGWSLHDRLANERLGIQEGIRVALAIADALGEAHAHGVLHRDLKPANVMIPRDGRIRVVDFGLAKWMPRPDLATADASLSLDLRAADVFESVGVQLRGTPSCMSPEQWRGAELTAATDIWALGLILHEVLAGEHPYRGQPARELARAVVSSDPVPMARFEAPHDLLAILHRCLAKEESQRPTAEDVAGELRTLLQRPGPRVGLEESPFRGLLPWDEVDAGGFHGRKAEIDAFVERLRETPILPVVGASGAGKSSFVRAGVVPRLREQGEWTILPLRPGARPLRALAAQLLRGGTDVAAPPRLENTAELVALSRDGSQDSRGSRALLDRAEADLTQRLRASPDALALVLLGLAEQEGSRVLLFLDQAEELYTHERDPERRRLFLDAICRAADDPLGPVRVILSFRDDYLSRLAETRAAREALARVVVLRTPGPDALREILLRPVMEAGYRYEDPALVEEMVADVDGEPAALPLLQVAGQSLWERRDRDERCLRRADYEAVGRVAGALARHADGVLEGLTAPQTELARTLLLRLVTPEGTRRVVPVDALFGDVRGDTTAVLDRLIEGRLVVARGGREGGMEAGAVELAHESLIGSWERLVRWRDQAREELTFLAEAGQAADLWERRGRRAEEVWAGAALRDALAMAAQIAVLPGSIRSFLDAGRQRAHRRTRARRRLLGAVIAGLVAAAAVTGILALEARRQRDDARLQRSEAEERTAEALREGAAVALEDGDLLGARARIRASLELRDDPHARLLWHRMSTDPRLWTASFSQHMLAVRLSPDGATVAVSGEPHTLRLLDAETGRTQSFLGSAGEMVTALAFSADGSRLFVGTLDGGIRIRDVSTGEDRGVMQPHAAAINDLEASADGRWIASAAKDGAVRLWDAMEGTLVHALPEGAEATSLRFDASGAVLAVGRADGSVETWQVDAGERLRGFDGGDDRVSDVAFSPDGALLIAVAYDEVLRSWDPHTGEGLGTIPGLAGDPRSLAALPDGRHVVVAGREGVLQLWDLELGGRVAEYEGHSSRIMELALDDRRERVVTASYDRTVRAWAIGDQHPRRRESPPAETVWMASFSSDGHRIASAGETTVVRDAADAGVLWTRLLVPIPISQALTPDGETLVQVTQDGHVRVVDVESSETVRTFYPPWGKAITAEVCREGRSVVITGDGVLGEWELATGIPVTDTIPIPEGAQRTAMMPDGRGLVGIGDDGAVRVFGWPSAELRAEIAAGVAPGTWLQIAPDGSRALVIDQQSPEVSLIDLAGREVIPIPLPEGVLPSRGGFSPDGQSVVFAASDGLVYAADREGNIVARFVGARDETTEAGFDGTGDRVVASSEDGTVRVWDAANGQPLWWASALLADPPELCTRRGWIPLGVEDDAPQLAESSSWRTAAVEAARAARDPESDTLCLASHGGTLQAWHTGDDRLLWQHELAVSQLVGHVGGCLALDDRGTVRAFGGDGVEATLAEDVLTIGRDAQGVWYATDDEAIALDSGGAVRGRVAIGAGATAMLPMEDGLAVGYGDGRLDYLPHTGAGKTDVPLAGLPGSAVETLAAGPAGTLAVGFVDGHVGVWSLADGALLDERGLHGPVAHLRMVDRTLYAASELGDIDRIDLSALALDYCDLLGEIWAVTPAAWQDGEASSRPPPVDHVCSR